jgi:imidazolonepropionase-like amidohydrolase
LIVRPGRVLENTSILVQGGKIVQVGKDIAVPEGAKEVKGAVVCASYIDPWSALGIDANVLADQKLDPAARTADGLDLYSEDHLRSEAVRSGVTTARLQGGWRGATCGLGAMVRLDPQVDDPDAAVLLADADLGMSLGLSVDQGSRFQRMPDGSLQFVSGDRPVDVFDRVSAVDKLIAGLDSGRGYRVAELEYDFKLKEWQDSIKEKTEELNDDFKKAKKARDKEVKKAEEKGNEHKDEKYKEDRKPKQPKYSADKSALAQVAEGELPLVVEVHRAGELRNLLAGTESFTRLRLVIAGGTEALSCSKQLAERGIPVIVWPSLRGTSSKDEFQGDDLSLAASLSEAGVQVLLGSGGRDSSATRDLPLLAEMAIGHGFDRDKAFEAMTLGAATTFDLGRRLGSVEVGKDADLLVLDGMPLEPNSHIKYVFCGGRLVVTPQN